MRVKVGHGGMEKDPIPPKRVNCAWYISWALLLLIQGILGANLTLAHQSKASESPFSLKVDNIVLTGWVVTNLGSMQNCEDFSSPKQTILWLRDGSLQMVSEYGLTLGHGCICGQSWRRLWY